jgi:hypothetical protein
VRISHSELVDSVLGSVAFEAIKYELNPGIAETFPWLSSQATGWEQYVFHKLCFEYKTRCATSTVGSVLLIPEYDPSDRPPETEAQASAYSGCVEDVPWRNQMLNFKKVNMFPMGPRKFLRDQKVGGADLKTYDVGALYLGTVEEASAAAIGKLWVHYDVEFFIPQSLGSSVPIAKSLSLYSRAAAQTITTATWTDIEFDTTVVDGLGIGNGTSGVFTLPKGAYLVQAKGNFQDNATEAFTGILRIFRDAVTVDQSSFNNSSSAAPSQSMSCQYYVTSDGTNTVKVQVYLVGAAGTLTSIASPGTTNLVIQAV